MADKNTEYRRQKKKRGKLLFYFSADNWLAYKHDGRSASPDTTTDGFIYESDDVTAWLDKEYAAQKVRLKADGKTAVNLRQTAEMAILFRAARQVLPLALSKKG